MLPSPENATFYFQNFVSWARAEGVYYFYFKAFDELFKAAYEGIRVQPLEHGPPTGN